MMSNLYKAKKNGENKKVPKRKFVMNHVEESVQRSIGILKSYLLITK